MILSRTVAEAPIASDARPSERWGRLSRWRGVCQMASPARASFAPAVATPLSLWLLSGILLLTLSSALADNNIRVSGERLNRAGLADLRVVAPGIVVDLRYATTNNVAGKRLYPSGMPCLLHRSTAYKLAEAQELLRREGFGLKVWDAYRPPQAHRALWKAAPSSNYVVPPSAGLSRHCAGVAVDVTLVDSQGREMRMPTKFDSFSPEASSFYRGGDPEVRRNLERLQRAMRKAGFVTIPNEWWHFDEAGPTSLKAVPAGALGIEMPSHVRIFDHS